MEQCLNIAKRLFNESECRETFKNHCFSPLDTNIQTVHPNEFYAFSTYYYTASLLRLSPGTPLNLKQSWAHAERLCTVGLLDVLCCQPIKLFQVVSTSEYHEYQWNNVVFIFFCPLGFLEGLRSLKQRLLQKVSMTNLDQKFRFVIKKYVF